MERRAGVEGLTAGGKPLSGVRVSLLPMREPLIRSISDTARWVAFHRASESERSGAILTRSRWRASAGSWSRVDVLSITGLSPFAPTSSIMESKSLGGRLRPRNATPAWQQCRTWLDWTTEAACP